MSTGAVLFGIVCGLLALLAVDTELWRPKRRLKARAERDRAIASLERQLGYRSGMPPMQEEVAHMMRREMLKIAGSTVPSTRAPAKARAVRSGQVGMVARAVSISGAASPARQALRGGPNTPDARLKGVYVTRNGRQYRKRLDGRIVPGELPDGRVLTGREAILHDLRSPQTT